MLKRAPGLARMRAACCPHRPPPSLPHRHPQQLQAPAQLGAALGFGWVTQAESWPSCSLAALSPILPREPILKAEVGLGVGDRERGCRRWGCSRRRSQAQEGLCAPLHSLVVCRSSQAAPTHAPCSARERGPSAWTQAGASLCKPRAHFGSPASASWL